jgi:hypothetical protein
MPNVPVENLLILFLLLGKGSLPIIKLSVDICKAPFCDFPAKIVKSFEIKAE